MKKIILVQLVLIILLFSYTSQGQEVAYKGFGMSAPPYFNKETFFMGIYNDICSKPMTSDERLDLINNYISRSHRKTAEEYSLTFKDDFIFDTEDGLTFYFENSRGWQNIILELNDKNIVSSFYSKSRDYHNDECEILVQDGIIQNYVWVKNSKWSEFVKMDKDIEKGLYIDENQQKKYYLEFENYPYDRITEKWELDAIRIIQGDTVPTYNVSYVGKYDGVEYKKIGKKYPKGNPFETKFGWWEYYENDLLFLKRNFFDNEIQSSSWKFNNRRVNKIINEIWTAKKIPIRKYGSLNYITINIGGKEFDFLLDTGASDVLINSEIEQHLLNTGVLRTSDYSERVEYTFADGSSKYFKTANVYSVKIGDTKFSNINVAIGDSNSSLLLGMSFLNRFDWRINGDFLELTEK